VIESLLHSTALRLKSFDLLFTTTGVEAKDVLFLRSTTVSMVSLQHLVSVVGKLVSDLVACSKAEDLEVLC
jgi:hypothetical protein